MAFSKLKPFIFVVTLGMVIPLIKNIPLHAKGTISHSEFCSVKVKRLSLLPTKCGRSIDARSQKGGRHLAKFLKHSTGRRYDDEKFKTCSFIQRRII